MRYTLFVALIALSLSSSFAMADHEVCDTQEVHTYVMRCTYASNFGETHQTWNEIREMAGPYCPSRSISGDGFLIREYIQDIKTEIVNDCWELPHARFVVSQVPENSLGHNMVVVESTSTHDGDNLSYRWYLNGEYVGNNRRYQYNTLGGYSVTFKLVITDERGYKSSRKRTVYLEPWRNSGGPGW